ncbi:acyltransferase family protein [Rhodovulum adriaticum]|uniref:Peptidoglycan/LPS O-acetylase OafA/YrhL n=1 Tax=Rhodovulum adriaticum TaxID=35804 RepID=A0A4R2NY96_RHOAD|nr:acyltransferase family protein [Rhodovulum adriaticum]MBK1634200.1 hypothetical protein [Rhodovulum adriaticum]TCP27249.1 peptidoglycan/LPS O-acetylase OafA/YrhL [Rhodovulum adriaticum]
MTGYRPEIDGLRAFAVLPVILFHAGFAGFSGGFVGVDVFFVISGYLITSILLREHEAGSFSIWRFWERRARRILPALYLVMAVTVPLAWMLMLPDQYQAYARSLIAVSVFASNILFWQESGYFAAASEEKPLLHTWSLAVEEQYYIFFPLAMLLLWRFGRRAVFFGIALVLLVSLGLSQYAASASPAANFFLLPTRAWELMAGALCALWLSRRRARGSDLLAGLGLVLILAAVVLYDETTPFPSLYGLAPVGGTALIVLFAWPGGRVAQLLAWRPIVAVGLVSYSAYLWHQPLFAFARIGLPAPPPGWVMLGLSALSLGLAALSWRFVEQPFRNRHGLFRGKRLALALVPAVALMVAAGAQGELTEGRRASWLASAPPAQAQMYRLYETARAGGADLIRDPNLRCVIQITSAVSAQARLERCYRQHGPGLLVVGDSHSRMVMPALQRLTGRPFVVTLAQGGCRPFTGRSDCHYPAQLPALIAERPEMFSHIVYHNAAQALLDDGTPLSGERTMFERYGPEEPMPPFRPDAGRTAAVRAFLDRLVVPGGPQVIWLGPQIGHYLPIRTLIRRGCTARWHLRPGQADSFVALDRAIAQAMAAPAQIAGGPNPAYLPLIPLMHFDPGSDIVSCDALYWIDGHHWSQAGISRFGPRLAPLAEMLQETENGAARDD